MRAYWLVLAVVPAVISTNAGARLYKWVDDNGQVHYSDHVPAEYLKKEREVLNDQGASVKKLERAMTAEEREAKRLEEAEQRRIEKEKREQQLRDRVLTDTYTTERDLIAARDARLDAIDSQIRLSEDIIADSTDKVAKTQERIDKIRASGREVPAATYAKLEREKQQLATQREVGEGHRKKRAEIEEQFEGYIIRFRELMAEKEKRKAAAAGKNGER